ncbi:hypothetical protein IFM89_004509 [Coptis chinensis]|uniref:Suppressor of forked domain-containing protein n=1 Tax=Coptis chinensis TaxID=261450 RepID=A0A835LCQ5_9MAGN|nr:hypothetical protein IFM89_004509 [Coptis chinensis]
MAKKDAMMMMRDESQDKYNVEASDSLASQALVLPISDAVPIYEQLVTTFPTSLKYWKQYVEAYMAINNHDATKLIFSRSLFNCLHISLWRCYIRFIRKINENTAAEGQEETRKAFDFMLNYVGTDIASGPVWMEYITFLKSMPAMNPQEESQRMTLVRKAYQKAIVIPTHHVEQLWKDYENFENSVSRALAKGLLSEYQPKYNSAKVVYRERKKYVDEIEWNMLAVPPTGSYKAGWLTLFDQYLVAYNRMVPWIEYAYPCTHLEEQQYMAWKRFLAFEKGNPQRIDSSSSNRRIAFTYEQCLMYLYHYPDIWYDYATWQAKSGSIDSAIKVFQRALKALPDSEVLWYAYAESEESRGEIQSAKKIYESLLGNNVSVTALSHIQFIRFLRRTEGIEAARKYFLDARKTPNCTYHVYVAYAMMAFCLDKDPKVAHNVFEAGLKRFMHEPGYILDILEIYMFFCLVWKRFTEFEQTYGDLASMLKVEQRRKEALSRTGEEGASALEASLHDVVSRYSFMDLWPCSPKDLDHLARQEWLVKNIDKKSDKSTFPNGANSIEKGSSGLTSNSKLSTPSTKVVYPDTSRMVVYDPRQKHVTEMLPNAAADGLPSGSSSMKSTSNVASVGSATAKPLHEILKLMPPALVEFITQLPAVEGPSPNVEIVLSVLLQSNIPTGQAVKVAAAPQQLAAAPSGSTSDLSGSNKSRQNPNESSFKLSHTGKRKDVDRHEDDETATVQSRPLPRDAFMIRQIRKARGVTSSQTGSASGGSMISGELSGSTE